MKNKLLPFVRIGLIVGLVGSILSTVAVFANSLSTETTFSADLNTLPANSVLWRSGHESGSINDWLIDQDDAIFNSGNAQISVTDTVAYSGTYSLQMTIEGLTGTVEHGARIFRFRESAPDAYYSAWFYFPEVVDAPTWWNVFQFKSISNTVSLPTWVLNVGTSENQTMHFYLWDGIQSTSHGGYTDTTPIIPVGEWVHVEVHLVRANDATGLIEMWMNGEQLYRFENVQTSYGTDVAWGLGNYADTLTPNDVTIYVDEAAITTDKVGILIGSEPTPVQLRKQAAQGNSLWSVWGILLLVTLFVTRFALGEASKHLQPTEGYVELIRKIKLNQFLWPLLLWGLVTLTGCGLMATLSEQTTQVEITPLDSAELTAAPPEVVMQATAVIPTLTPVPRPTETPFPTLEVVDLFVPESAESLQPADILWKSSTETGDLSEWQVNQSGESVFNTGTGRVELTNSVVRTGNHALKLSIENANNQTQAARIFRWAENPQAAYYSAWFYFPEKINPDVWWNIFQFKSNNGTSLPTWIVNVDVDDGTGEMSLYLWDDIADRSHYDPLPGRSMPVPVGEWVHIEMYVTQAQDATGKVVLWQDGVRLYDIPNVQTTLSENIQWSINNYTDNITPSNVTIYADDAMISLKRRGVNQ